MSYPLPRTPLSSAVHAASATAPVATKRFLEIGIAWWWKRNEKKDEPNLAATIIRNDYARSTTTGWSWTWENVAMASIKRRLGELVRGRDGRRIQQILDKKCKDLLPQHKVSLIPAGNAEDDSLIANSTYLNHGYGVFYVLRDGGRRDRTGYLLNGVRGQSCPPRSIMW